MRKIAWITANCFIDVDLPILPIISKKYNIDWFVVNDSQSKISYDELIQKHLNDSGIKIVEIFLKSRVRNPKLFFEYLNLCFKIKENKYDIYYIDLPGFPYFLPILRLLLNPNKIIIALHNVSIPKGAQNEILSKIYNWVTLSFFTYFHVFSKSQYDYLINKHKKKKVMYAPLALKDFGKSNGEKSKEIVFLNFGIIRDYKRVDTLINAAIIAKEKTNIPFKIRIAGRCDNWTHYQRMIKFPEIFELKIGQVPNNEVPELFNTSHYFVLPYQDIAQSGALTVALNYNLPIIASRLPSFEEFIEDGKTGFLIKPASIEDLSEKIIFILHNHDKIYPELKISLKKFVDDNLKKETIAERYVDFFKDI